MEALTDIGYMKSVLQKHGFHFSKALGQNFLTNPTVCPRMAEACGLTKEWGALEVGPGCGVLTRELAHLADKVVALELDARLLPVLEETLAEQDNVKVIHGDVLKTDLTTLLQEEFGDRPVAICANLPYYITSPVIMYLLESRVPAECITVMVQKEAAERLCAKPGTRECGAVTLAVQYYAEVEKLFSVSRGSFMPSPKVDSMVIRLKPKKELPLEKEEEKRLFSLIKAAFGQRRKTLVNALQVSGLQKEQIKEILDKAGISQTARAEQLSMEDFLKINILAGTKSGL
ncbi:MAG: 16S rRNA (adenine(1518)-N(6)/adenine(1519)-N(6))-dimethyltransferase RsmA [Clostridia bacterium]|nr:16S rRNA (adenine(1518)-N(6)/adenine(1519)-N(6))-dimethyltransferase RsmA [Clostridia bacterium]